MRLLDNGSLALLLNLLSPRNQHSDGTGLLLALRKHNNRLALLQLATPVPFLIRALIRHLDIVFVGLRLLPRRPLMRHRQPAALTRQAGSHERRAREHEADGAAVYPDGGEALREAVDELEVGHDGVLLRRRVGLEEKGRGAVDDVQRHAVGKLDLLERGLLGDDVVDERRQERVGGQERLAQVALDRGFELLFG